MKVLGNLELVGGSLVNAVLEVLGAAPTKAGTGREGQLYLTADGLGYIDSLGANQRLATVLELTGVANAAAGKLDLELGGTVVGGVTFNSDVTFGANLTRASLPASANDVVNKSYVDNLVENGVEWADPVSAFVATLPAVGDSANGDRVILDTDNKLYEFDGAAWVVEEVKTGTSVFVDGTNAGFRFDGAAWVRFTGTGNQTAGDGLTITGNVLNLVGGYSLNVTADAVDVKVGTGLVIDETAGVQIDPNYTASLLSLGGGTMTGDITLVGAPTQDLHAATKKYVDDSVAGLTTIAKFAYTADVAKVTHVVSHNLNVADVTVSVFDADGELVQADSVVATDNNTVTVTLATAAIVKVVVVG